MEREVKGGMGREKEATHEGNGWKIWYIIPSKGKFLGDSPDIENYPSHFQTKRSKMIKNIF